MECGVGTVSLAAEIDVDQIAERARRLRVDVIRALTEAKSGHTGASLGLADIMAVLFFGGVMRYDPKRPDWEGRDRLVLSCGHACPILYVALAHAGYFPIEWLGTLRKLGTKLQGHPCRQDTPGVETAAGSLGQGVGVSVGMAMALKMDGKPNRVFCVCSDGEHEEGSSWEAAMAAAHYRCDNLTWILDRNYLQIDGKTEEIIGLDPLAEKFAAFNWHVIPIDGHDVGAIHSAIVQAMQNAERPTVIIARTIMGKGVSIFEDDHRYHGRPPKPDQAEIAMRELGESE
jgi:transketolase